MKLINSSTVYSLLAAFALCAAPAAADAETYDNDLQQLYVAYLGRPADPVGLTYWNNVITNAIAGGQSLDTVLGSVSNTFGASEEYLANFENLTSVQKISRIYNNLFSHDPDPTGLVYWANRLESGELAIGQISKIIANSAAEDSNNADGIAFNSKVTGAALFTDALDSTPEILGYSGVAARDLAKAFINRINSAATLGDETSPAALQQTVNLVTNAGNQLKNQTDSVIKDVTTDLSKIVVDQIVNQAAVTAAAPHCTYHGDPGFGFLICDH